LQYAEARANRGEKISRNFRSAALTHSISNRHFPDLQSRFKRADLHDHVPPKSMFTHIDVLERLAPNEP
jgi:hypothetical protein